MLKGIYLCSRKHRIMKYDIDYNDIVPYEGINILKDCYDINLDFVKSYDYIIATPPCNYYSRANYRRDTSKVALLTKDLLPHCIDLCLKSGKPFIIENVCNSSLLPKAKCVMFDFGNHTFYTNMLFLVPHKSYAVKQNKQYVCSNKRDDNYNVDLIIKLFLEAVHNELS